MDKSQRPQISLIIPVYNMEKYLEKCLDTAVSQTYHNYEIIIVDDGSIDSSYQICVEYSKRYDNIVLIHKENEGLMSAWQCGFSASKGEYISFLDSDDWIEPDYIERLSKGINVDADVVCCNKIWEFGDGIVLKKELLNPGCYDRKALVEDVFPRILNNGLFLGRLITPHRCGKLFKRDILQRNIMYCDNSISFGEDLNIVFPVLIDCNRLLVLNDKTGLYHYRQNNNSIIRSYKKNMFAQIDKLHARLIEVNDEKNAYDFRAQIDADGFCLFLDYVKNEAKNKKEKKDKITNILNNYQIFRKTFKGNSYKKIKLKASNKILVFLLEKKMFYGLDIWCNLYYIIGKKNEKKCSSALLIRNKKVLMMGPHESVKGGIRTVVDNYLKWNSWNNVEIVYIPTFIEKHYLVKICFFLWNYLKILFTCIFGKIDIVHLHVSERGSFYRKALVLMLCRIMNIKTILHHHGAEFMEFYSASSAREKKFIKYILKKADLNLVLSEYQKRQMESTFSEISLKVLYNAVEGYKENNYNSEANGILFLGRLCERKGVYDFLEAFAECEKRIDKDIKLYLCGDGDIDKVKRVIKELKLKNRIAFVGWCSKSKLQEIYKKTMLYILPSYHEGLPMSLLETMSYGIPCIASDVAAIPEVIRNGENGILISPGETGLIKSTLLKLLMSEDRVRLGNNGFETVNNSFLLKKKMAELEDIYNGIMCLKEDRYDHAIKRKF